MNALTRAGLAGVGAFALLFAQGCSSSAYNPSNSSEAKAQCEGFAKQRLKAPSTADFHLSAQKAGSRWDVVGTVDAENSFGAKIRNDVTCEIHFNGDTAYLDDISLR